MRADISVAQNRLLRQFVLHDRALIYEFNPPGIHGLLSVYFVFHTQSILKFVTLKIQIEVNIFSMYNLKYMYIKKKIIYIKNIKFLRFLILTCSPDASQSQIWHDFSIARKSEGAY